MELNINKVAVLGAGVMGAQIAAHLVNSGFTTLLYDLADERDHNAIVKKAITNLKKQKPQPLGSMDLADLICPRNYEDNLDELQGCDLIIEAIAEKLEWKEVLYKKVSPYINEHALLVSNTSGLSINKLASFLPANLQTRFAGVHFFNPPRYMHLTEIIPSKKTDEKYLDNLETWLTRYLGKGVIRAKDTPNFIANRVGVFSLLSILRFAEIYDLTFDEVDALTGPLLGRPKSATFRTMDVVGLDTMAHVVKTMQDELREDPWHSYFNLPEYFHSLIKNKHLGQKTGAGFYRKVGKVIEVYSPKQNDYIGQTAKIAPDVSEAMAAASPKEKFALLLKANSNQANFLKSCFRELFAYCAYHLPDIALNVGDVDLAMQWGFGWQQGPFAIWESFGLDAVVKLANENTLLVELPNYLAKLYTFYTEEGGYSPVLGTYVYSQNLPVYERQIYKPELPKLKQRQFKTLYEDPVVKLSFGSDSTGILSFKTKANSINQDVLDGINNCINYANEHLRGLVIYQENEHLFSAGADLKAVLSMVKEGGFASVRDMICSFQNTLMRLKYSSFPVVCALRGRALGGGAELLMHTNYTVAAFESYPGLVELGVGLIPAGGGCKEIAMRAAQSAIKADLFVHVREGFLQIAKALVAGSALEAEVFNYLNNSSILMHSGEVLLGAIDTVNMLTNLNFRPPKERLFPVIGREGKARLELELVNWLKGNFISEYDFFLCNKLAYVISGGDVSEGELVDESWLLKLELETFMSLIQNKKSQDRMEHMLTTGKPLRN